MENEDGETGSGASTPSYTDEQPTTPTKDDHQDEQPASADNPHRCVQNGIPMTWNEQAKQWLPDVEVDEDFLANYHLNYGVQYDYSQMQKSSEGKDGEAAGTSKKAPLTKEEKKALKREADKPVGWVDIEDDKNTNVYVSGLPATINEASFIELMSKYGVIMKDPRTNRPKVKLYKTDTGEPKGDGTCCYVRMESVALALQILDGSDLEGSKVHVEKAQFQMKGEFDPAKKKKKLSAAQKKRFFENQQKIFEWKPDKPRNYRPISDCTVVLRNMFTLDELDANAARIIDIRQEVKELCDRFGTVRKTPIVYDTNPEGVVTVTFDNVEGADIAVRMLNGRVVANRKIHAALWDGKEKFKREETEEERKRRDQAWSQFIGDGDTQQDDRDEDNNAET